MNADPKGMARVLQEALALVMELQADVQRHDPVPPVMVGLNALAQVLGRAATLENVTEPSGEATEVQALLAEQTSYEILTEAIEKSLQPCIVGDDVAEEAIFAGAIEEAGMAISAADDALHAIRAQLSRELARKHNQHLSMMCTLIDAMWDESVTFGRLHEQRRAASEAGR